MSDIAISLVGYTGFVSVALWLSRTWIRERLTASIRLETEQKLARFKADLEAMNQQVRDISSAGTAANAQVESALLEHRIKAVKKIWESVLSWRSVSVATMMVSVLDQDWLKENASHPGTTTTFETLMKNSDYASFMKEQNDVELVRPFLSEPMWASYQAYYSFLSARLTKAWILALPGLKHAEMLSKFDEVGNERDLVEKSATAEILAIYDKNSYMGTEPYLNFLKERMLIQFRELLSGQRAGQQAAENASQILRAADALHAQSLATSKEVEQSRQN